MRRTLLVGLFTASASACTAAEQSWNLPSGTGKADGVAIVDGSIIPSQFVDPAKRYFSSRSLTSLTKLGLLLETTTIARIDGVFPGQAKNNRIELAELVELESQLSGEELEQLAKVWTFMQAPSGPPVTVELPTLDLAVHPTRVPPNGSMAGVARLVVPEPTLYSHEQVLAEDVTAKLDTMVTLMEHRRRDDAHGTWTTTLKLEASRLPRIMGHEHKELVINLDTGKESATDGDSAYGPGRLVYEQYPFVGPRRRSIELIWPSFTRGADVTSLDDYVDYEMVTANNDTPLPKLCRYGNDQDDGINVDFVYSRLYTSEVDGAANWTRAVETPISSLPSGRYSVPAAGTPVVLELYPTGVVYASRGSESQRMSFSIDAGWNSGTRVLVATVGGAQVSFAPETNWIRIGDKTQTVTAAMRVP